MRGPDGHPFSGSDMYAACTGRMSIGHTPDFFVSIRRAAQQCEGETDLFAHRPGSYLVDLFTGRLVAYVV